MVRLIAVGLLAACAKHGQPPPPSPLQDGAVQAIAIDAAAPAPDAPVARSTAGAVKVVVGVTSACALLDDGTVRCWGGNAYGQLGDGSTKTSVDPVMPRVRGVKDLVLGDEFACALIDDSSVSCWGQIGFGKGRNTLAPAAAPGVHDIVKLFAIGGAACGTDEAGALVCWGDVDARGHLLASGASHAPTPVPGLTHVVALTAHAAITEDHALFTWTDGSPTASGITTALELAEREAPCALTSTGEVACVADPPVCAKPAVETKRPSRHAHKAKPVKTAEPAARYFLLPFAQPEHLAFDTGLCVQTRADRFDCIDVANHCAVQRPWPAFVTIAQLSGSCARLANGTVRCGSSGSQAAPVIEGVADAIAISATASRGCALTRAHAVLCWEGTAAATPVALSVPRGRAMP